MPLTAMMIAGGLGAAGNVGSALIGSSSASEAAQQAAEAQQAALGTVTLGQQNAVNVLSPYYTGGLQNYDLLNYLMTGNAGNVQGLTPDQQAQLTSDQNFLNYWTPYGNTAAGAPQYQGILSDYNKLTQQQQAATAASGAAGTAAASGLPANYLTNIPSFNFDLAAAMAPGGAGAEMGDLAMQEIAAQRSASGGFGSGNQATDISNYIGGTFQPELYSEAAQTYNTNQITPRQMIYNMLTGNTGGSGQNVAGNMANVYTGTAATAAPYQAGVGSAQASGTAGASNAYTNALAGVSNQGTAGASLYTNYLSSQNIANAIQNMNSMNPSTLYANNQWANNTAANPSAWGGSWQDF